MSRTRRDRGAGRAALAQLVALVGVSMVAGYVFARVVQALVLSQGCRDVVGSSAVCSTPSILGLAVVGAVTSFVLLLALRWLVSGRLGRRGRAVDR